jgi:hypothetical protein
MIGMPHWITTKLKTAIKRNARVYRKWVNRGRNENDHDKIREVQNITNKLIREAKQSYYKKLCEKLSDPQTGQKDFWNAFKRITKKSKHTNIPPMVDNKFMYRIFFKKLIYLMTILLTNVKYLTMAVLYLNFLIKLTHQSIISI